MVIGKLSSFQMTKIYSVIFVVVVVLIVWMCDDNDNYWNKNTIHLVSNVYKQDSSNDDDYDHRL